MMRETTSLERSGMPTLSSALRAQYQQLFDTCQINASVAGVVDKLATPIMANAARYRSVADPLGVPWSLVCGGRAARHGGWRELRLPSPQR